MPTLNALQKVEALKAASHLLTGNRLGLEKENLRVLENGAISKTSHPLPFGSALTHPYITTDFSEALIELVTPPCETSESVMNFLTHINQFVCKHLPTNEYLWPASMPCLITKGSDIPIAEYGKSNQGQLKRLYRVGLSNRYGSMMQCIAGIHFNYSFAHSFLSALAGLEGRTFNRHFVDEVYMGVARNVIRFTWLLFYLFGASPIVCRSFFKDQKTQNFSSDCPQKNLYEPYATSLRMSSIGYKNQVDDPSLLQVSYNNVNAYAESLKKGTQTPWPRYSKIGLKKNNKRLQVNENVLQIENEYYSCIRPKPEMIEGRRKPLYWLKKNGVSYLELRSLDLNPFSPIGIDVKTLKFVESFMLFCLLEPSAPLSFNEQATSDQNNEKVSQYGRYPGLSLQNHNGDIGLNAWGGDLIEKISHASSLLGKGHEQAVKTIGRRLKHPEETPSAQFIQGIEENENTNGLLEFVTNLSRQHKHFFTQLPSPQGHFNLFEEEATKSLCKQQKIEAEDTLNFSSFLQEYEASEK